MNTKAVSVFAINLKSRTERRRFISSQFIDREEFDFYLIDAYEHSIGAIGLWNTIRHILQDLAKAEVEFIILCEDDHQFTPAYSIDQLLNCIEEAKEKNADILSGGISGFTSAIKVSDNLYWVEKFSGLQFTVVFQKFFQTVLDASFTCGDAADYKLCSLTENKFFIYPFLSIQKEFGYSDVTVGNNAQGHIDNVFKDSNEKVTILKTVSSFYKQRLEELTTMDMPSLEDIIIPTYVLNFAERKKQNTEKQFAEKKEFDVKIIEACHHKDKELALWQSLKRIIKTAIENDDDAIIICREGHQFTKHYEGSHFIKLIWQAGLLGCNVLIGGMTSFNLALPVTNNIFWIDSFRSSKFFVIYKSFYRSILQEPVCNTDTLESKFSEMTSNKMALHPFISQENGFKSLNNKSHFGNVINQHPMKANERLIKLKNVWRKFNQTAVQL
jgi:hypothetical protein